VTCADVSHRRRTLEIVQRLIGEAWPETARLTRRRPCWAIARRQDYGHPEPPSAPARGAPLGVNLPHTDDERSVDGEVPAPRLRIDRRWTANDARYRLANSFGSSRRGRLAIAPWCVAGQVCGLRGVQVSCHDRAVVVKGIHTRALSLADLRQIRTTRWAFTSSPTVSAPSSDCDRRVRTTSSRWRPEYSVIASPCVGR
jgi:hypothetical protein